MRNRGRPLTFRVKIYRSYISNLNPCAGISLVLPIDLVSISDRPLCDRWNFAMSMRVHKYGQTSHQQCIDSAVWTPELPRALVVITVRELISFA